MRLGAVQQHKAAPEEVGGGETTPSPHDKPAPQDNNQQTAPQVTDPTSEDIKRENSHTASQQQDPLGDGQSTSPDTKSIGDTQSPSGDSIDTLPQNPNPEQESALGMKSKHGIEQSDEEMPDPKRQKTDRQHPATSDASSSCSSASPKTPVMSTIPTQNNLGGDSSAGQVDIEARLELTLTLDSWFQEVHSHKCLNVGGLSLVQSPCLYQPVN